jgi:phosphatidylglycerol:prolipoprotein diacylglycerol transferase
LVEGLRTDSLMLGNIRVAQLISIVIIVLLSVVFIRRRKEK